MKQSIGLVAAAVVIGILTPGLGRTDQTGTVTSTTTSVMTDNQAKAPAPADMKWTELKGKVSRVDLQNNTIQIQESGSGKLVEVAVTDKVTVSKNDRHTYALGDIKQGDKVVLRNNS